MVLLVRLDHSLLVVLIPSYRLAALRWYARARCSRLCSGKAPCGACETIPQRRYCVAVTLAKHQPGSYRTPCTYAPASSTDAFNLALLAIAPANKLARIAVGGSQQGTLLRGYEDYCAFGPACVSVAPARNVTNVRKISDPPSVINTPSSP